MIKHIHKILHFIILFCILTFLGCQQQPQKAKLLGEEEHIDSISMAQMQFNIHMADAADEECKIFVQKDIFQYAMDDFGFWYTKTIDNRADTIQNGQELSLHIQISEIGGRLLSDSKHIHIVGSGELPIAITRSLKMMCVGDQMRVIAPWYTAYGVNGTSIIKAYSNLLITITIEK
jgi:hypothetical protein